MPFRKNAPKKRTYKKKFNPRSTISSAPATNWKNNVIVGKGFPKKMTMTHKYHEVVSHTSTLGAPGFYKFACNGMFDPNLTSVGHQPYYYDQMSAIYDHYTVIGAKIVVKVIPTNNNQNSFYVTMSQNDDTTQTAGIDATAEQSSGSHIIVPYGANDVVRILRNSWSAKKTFGGSVLGNDNLQGNATANPTEITVWTIGILAMDAISTVNSYLDISIEYIAVWDEIRDIAGS